MWNKDRSLALSRFAVGVFMLLLAAAAVLAPWLTKLFLDFSSAPFTGLSRQQVILLFLGYEYLSVPAAALVLWQLRGLLGRIGQGQVFVPANPRALRRISWACLFEAALCFTGAFWYLPFLLVSVAAGFMALIVRVVKNVMEQAVAIKDENDYTI